MKKQLVFFGLIVLIFGCQSKINKKRQELGLMSLTSEWTPYDTAYYFSYDSLARKHFRRLPDEEKERSNHIGQYWRTRKADIFRCSKILYYDIKNGQRRITDEIDVYEKELSELKMLRLEIIYDYSTDSLSSTIDTTATKYGIARLHFIRDSLYSNTNKSKAYICGSGLNETFANLTRSIPKFSIPDIIPVEKARYILKGGARNQD